MDAFQGKIISEFKRNTFASRQLLEKQEKGGKWWNEEI